MYITRRALKARARACNLIADGGPAAEDQKYTSGLFERSAGVARLLLLTGPSNPSQMAFRQGVACTRREREPQPNADTAFLPNLSRVGPL